MKCIVRGIGACLVAACLAVTSQGRAQQGPPPNYPPPGYPPPGQPPQYPAPGPYQTPGYAPPQYSQPPMMAPGPDHLVRQGVMWGFALGAGTIQGGGPSESGPALSFNIGGMLAPNLALMLDYSVVAHSVDVSASETHAIVAAALQFYWNRFLWIKGGLGSGQISQSDSYGDLIAASDTSLAFLAAVGAEVLQTTGGFALDLQLRTAGARYNGEIITNTAFLVGINFY